jgi:hypothetical protein
MCNAHLAQSYEVRSLPGSVSERQLQESLSRMFPELMRFSSARGMLDKVDPKLRDAHKPSGAPMCVSESAIRKTQSSIWDDWGDAEKEILHNTQGYESGDEDIDLDEMGKQATVAVF